MDDEHSHSPRTHGDGQEEVLGEPLQERARAEHEQMSRSRSRSAGEKEEEELENERGRGREGDGEDKQKHESVSSFTTALDGGGHGSLSLSGPVTTTASGRRGGGGGGSAVARSASVLSMDRIVEADEQPSLLPPSSPADDTLPDPHPDSSDSTRPLHSTPRPEPAELSTDSPSHPQTSHNYNLLNLNNDTPRSPRLGNKEEAHSSGPYSQIANPPILDSSPALQPRDAHTDAHTGHSTTGISAMDRVAMFPGESKDGLATADSGTGADGQLELGKDEGATPPPAALGFTQTDPPPMSVSKPVITDSPLPWVQDQEHEHEHEHEQHAPSRAPSGSSASIARRAGQSTTTATKDAGSPVPATDTPATLPSAVRPHSPPLPPSQSQSHTPSPRGSSKSNKSKSHSKDASNSRTSSPRASPEQAQLQPQPQSHSHPHPHPQSRQHHLPLGPGYPPYPAHAHSHPPDGLVNGLPMGAAEPLQRRASQGLYGHALPSTLDDPVARQQQQQQQQQPETAMYAQAHPFLQSPTQYQYQQQQQREQHQHQYRSSAPVLSLAASSSPLQGSFFPALSAASPVHPSGLDAAPAGIGYGFGFGASSPYPPIGGPVSPSALFQQQQQHAQVLAQAQAQAQRYSLPTGSSATSPSALFSSPLHLSPNLQAQAQASGNHPSYSTSPALSLPQSQTQSVRPKPTTAYGYGPGGALNGQGKTLPEMHPSALEARPSASAPFPPPDAQVQSSKSGLLRTRDGGNAAGIGATGREGQVLSTLVAPAAAQQRERADVSRPLGQEICLECLMRDRDMADVEVTGPGVWSRGSDIDFEEAVRAEELAIQQATAAAHAHRAAYAHSQTHGNGSGGGGGGSSNESAGVHLSDSRRKTASGALYMNGAHGNSSTDENYFVPGSFGSNGQASSRYVRSPSRESSLHSDSHPEGGSGRGGRRSNPPPLIPKRRIGGGHPLTSASLKLWTNMCQPSSAHRYRVLQDFVAEQIRYLAIERQAAEQSQVERERMDQALRDSSGEGTSVPLSPIQPGSYASSAWASSGGEGRGRSSGKKTRASSQVLPNGIRVETIDVGRDEKEARARAKAAAKGRRFSSNSRSPTESKRIPTPSVKSFNAPSIQNALDMPSADGSFNVPWGQDPQRRYSSPLLSNKQRNDSTDQLTLARSRPYDESTHDLRMSTQSMMMPPRTSAASPFRAGSPSRQSFQTTGTSGQRSSKGWRRSLWNRSASASVLSLAHSGSMMEMHLGMSQDKHSPAAQYLNNQADGVRAGPGGGGVWPENASAHEGSGGISPDESVQVVHKERKKKKGFKKFLNSLIGGSHAAVPAGATPPQSSKSRRAVTEHIASSGGSNRKTNANTRRESSLNYAAAYNDDYSEPLAPPPPLSFLTGQKPHRRSFSSSSQSSTASPVIPPTDNLTLYQVTTRPISLAVPNSASSNGFISPSTSSSDLNRVRPSSVTSWRSSSKTGSPQSPRDVIADQFGQAAPAVRQEGSDAAVAPGVRLVAGIEVIKDPEPADLGKLRREKSLPALPPVEVDENSLSPQALASSTYPIMDTLQPQTSRPPNRESRSASIVPHQAQLPQFADYDAQLQQNYAQGQDSSWQYSPEYEDVESLSSQKKARKSKSKSKLFSFGGRRSRRSSSSQMSQADYPAMPGRDSVIHATYAPHEAALEAVVRDDPAEMVAYRYPSVSPNV